MNYQILIKAELYKFAKKINKKKKIFLGFVFSVVQYFILGTSYFLNFFFFFKMLNNEREREIKTLRLRM